MNINYKICFLFLMLVLRTAFLNAQAISYYYREQIPQLEAELSSKPDNIILMDRLGYAYARTQQYDKAMVMWKNILKTRKRDRYMGSGIVDGFMDEKQHERAETVLSQYFEFFPDQEWARYDYGIVNYFLKNYKKALQEFELCLRIDSSHRGAHYWIGRIYYILGNLEKSTKELLLQATQEEYINGGYLSDDEWLWVSRQKRILSSLQPKTFEETRGLGVVFAKIGNDIKALQLLERARKMNSTDARVYFNLGGYYHFAAKTHSETIHNDNLRKANMYYEKALKLGYGGQDLRIWISENYLNIGDSKNAIRFYLQAIEEGSGFEAQYAEEQMTGNGNNADIWRKLLSEGLVGKIEHAKQIRKKNEEARIAKRRNDPALQKKLKERLKKIDEEQEKSAKEYEEPFYITYFREIAMLTALFIALIIIAFKLWYPLYLFAGNGHFKAGRYEEAAGYYEKLFVIRNGKYVPLAKLKEIYLKTGRRDEKAIYVFEKIYKNNPEDKEVITALANAYAEKTA